MTLTQLLETSNIPARLNGPTLRRELKKAKKHSSRFARNQMRTTRRKAVAAYRRQYFLQTAFIDSRVAVKRNEDIFIVCLLAVFILLFSSLNTAMNTMLLFLGTAYEIASFTGIHMGILILVVGGIIATLSGWIICLLLNMLSLTTMDGAVRKVNRSARATARTSLANAGRVTLAWAFFLGLLFGPIAIASAVTLWLYEIGAITTTQLIQNVPIFAVGIVSYLVVIIANFALMPYVALFETKTSLYKAFRRSHELVRRRGRIFIITGFILTAAVIYGAFILSAGIERILRIDQWLPFAILTLATIIAANCMTVVFYRKRKLARVN